MIAEIVKLSWVEKDNLNLIEKTTRRSKMENDVSSNKPPKYSQYKNFS